jgi:hypothetical protein
MDRMVQAHVNTVVMSYWSDMPQWSPMDIGPTTLGGVLDAVQGRPLVVMPTIEGGFEADHPEIPHWLLFNEFPFTPGSFELAPGLVNRIGSLVSLFKGRMNLWAKMYDRDGAPRYVVHLLDASSDLMDQYLPGADESMNHSHTHLTRWQQTWRCVSRFLSGSRLTLSLTNAALFFPTRQPPR